MKAITTPQDYLSLLLLSQRFVSVFCDPHRLRKTIRLRARSRNPADKRSSLCKQESCSSHAPAPLFIPFARTNLDSDRRCRLKRGNICFDFLEGVVGMLKHPEWCSLEWNIRWLAPDFREDGLSVIKLNDVIEGYLLNEFSDEEEYLWVSWY